MANSPTDNGKQTITFAYQQEGTAQGFNKILHGILPRGIISGGELSRVSNSEVNIARLQMLIGDDNVTTHVETGDVANVKTVSSNAPYIVATYTWENITSSYVNFQAMSLSDIKNTENVVILGKCVYSGSTMLDNFDYTRKTWTASHYNHDFGWTNQYSTRSPSFNVVPKDDAGLNDWTLIIEKGEGVIGGKKVELVNEKELHLQNSDADAENYFITNIGINKQRYDIVVMRSDGNPQYIMGKETSVLDPIEIPICPTNALAIAILEFQGGDSGISISNFTGDKIQYIFNDHYYGGSPTVGQKIGNNIINKHTLYI